MLVRVHNIMAINIIHHIMPLPELLQLESFTSLYHVATIHQIIVVSGQLGSENSFPDGKWNNRPNLGPGLPYNVLSKLEHRLPKIESRKPTGKTKDRPPNIEHRESTTDHRPPTTRNTSHS
jgi:hypothetical protein